MTTPAPAAGTPSDRSPGSVAARWLHPRRKRFWLIALLLLYTLTIEQQPLVGWERLDVDRFETDTAVE